MNPSLGGGVVRTMRARAAAMLLALATVGATQQAPEDAPQVPVLWRLGPVPAGATAVVVAANGSVHGDVPQGADRPLLLRADRAAPWAAVYGVLARAQQGGLDRVHFAATLPQGAVGTFTLALPVGDDAAADLHLHLHHQRPGVPPTSAALLLQRLRRGLANDERFTLGIGAVAEAPFGIVLQTFAVAADAGFDRIAPWLSPAATAQGHDAALAMDLGPGPTLRVPPSVAPLGRVAQVPVADGSLQRADNDPRDGRVTPSRFLADVSELDLDGANWVRRSQLANGAWPDDDGLAGLEETALMMLALAAEIGSDVTRAQYGTTMARGAGWLLAQQQQDGRFGDGVRATALAGYALTEASAAYPWGTRLRGAAADTLSWLAQHQHDDGGFGANPATADAETTTWCLLAFAAARHHRIDATLSPDRILRWFDTTSVPTDGHRAARLLCRIVGGPDPDAALRAEAGDIAADLAVDDPVSAWFASHALFALGGAPWQVWRPKLDGIARSQFSGAREVRGSWDATPSTSRVTTTALRILALQCYYRHSRIVR